MPRVEDSLNEMTKDGLNTMSSHVYEQILNYGYDLPKLSYHNQINKYNSLPFINRFHNKNAHDKFNHKSHSYE